MYQILLYTHSGFRYAVFVLLVALLVKSLQGWLGKQPYTTADDKVSLFFFISAHLMLTFGLVLYFVSPNVSFAEGVMKNPTQRYYTVEHISMNIVAIVLFSLARILGKKKNEALAKHKTVFLYTLAGTLVLLVSLTSPQGPGVFGGILTR
jgi:membrane protein DedA with SNARE-associated domain